MLSPDSAVPHILPSSSERRCRPHGGRRSLTASMGALGTLGIGLSVLFGVFLAVLAAEIYYMLCWRQSRLGGARSNKRRVNSVQVLEAQAAAAAIQMGGYAHEAALVGSFGGYPESPLQSEFVTKFFPPMTEDYHVSPPYSFLFTIAEETKEEMELHNGVQNVDFGSSASTADASLKVFSNIRFGVDPVIPSTAFISVGVSGTSASSTSASSSVTPDATPFATPPSSPTSSDNPLWSPSLSPMTAISRFSVHSPSDRTSALSSPATAVSRLSAYSTSPTSTAASPIAAASRFSVHSPLSVAVSPATIAASHFSIHSSASTSSASHRYSVNSSHIYADHGVLEALFRRTYNSPSRYAPLGPPAWSGNLTDFRGALPFNPEFFTNR